MDTPGSLAPVTVRSVPELRLLSKSNAQQAMCRTSERNSAESRMVLSNVVRELLTRCRMLSNSRPG